MKTMPLWSSKLLCVVNYLSLRMISEGIKLHPQDVIDENPISLFFSLVEQLEGFERNWDSREEGNIGAALRSFPGKAEFASVDLATGRLDYAASAHVTSVDLGLGGTTVCFRHPEWVYIVPEEYPQVPASFSFLPPIGKRMSGSSFMLGSPTVAPEAEISDGAQECRMEAMPLWVCKLLCVVSYLSLRMIAEGIKLHPLHEIDRNPVSLFFSLVEQLKGFERNWDGSDEGDIGTLLNALPGEAEFVMIGLNGGEIEYYECAKFKEMDLWVGTATICLTPPEWIYIVPVEWNQIPASFAFLPPLGKGMQGKGPLVG